MPDPLEQSKALLVRRWGELGGYWGINRSMAEVHALLFVSARPLCTDDIMAALHISRGNASMTLRALVDWGLASRSHRPGDRKDYFEADSDVWHMFETILRERRRREVEPIIATIDRCRSIVLQAGDRSAANAAERREFLRRLDELQGFLRVMSTLFDLVLRFGSRGIQRLARSLAKAPGQAVPDPLAIAAGLSAGRAVRSGRRPGSTERRAGK